MSERRRKRITIGVLIDWTMENYQHLLLGGILDFVHERDLSCIFFEGGALEAEDEYESQRNIIFDLPGRENVDGLIILAAPLIRYTGLNRLAELCARFSQLPAVSIGAELPGMPAVLADNSRGFRKILIHLIEHHSARRFAFIRGTEGNPDAEERYSTFSAVLKEYGLPLDPGLVFRGSFTNDSGSEAMEYFLGRGLDGVDAVVAANDNMAVGALETLSRRAPELAGRLCVTGFDDLDIAAYADPPLTTVRQPIREQGWIGGRLLLDLLSGKMVPPRTYLSTTPVIRSSCGCPGGGDAAQSAKAAHAKASSAAARPDGAAERESGRSGASLTAALIEMLGHGLAAGDEKEFIETCAEIGRRVTGLDFSLYQELLNGLWRLRPPADGRRGLSAEARDACFRAVMNVGKQAIQTERDRLMGSLQENRSLQLIRELIVTLDLERQMGILAYRLPEVSVMDCYIALYDADRTQARSLLGFRDGRRTEARPTRAPFPVRDLVPDDFLSGAVPRCVIIKALKTIGFILVALEPKRLRFLAFLSDIIGGAMEAAIHYKELQSQKNDLSRALTNMRQAMAGFIQTMSLTVETHDPYTAGHQHRVSDLARCIAQEMGLPPAQVECVRMASIVHDLGKIYVPSEILNRSGGLSEIEFNMVKRHPQVAYDILKNVDFPWPIAEIVYEHHERLDGSGYPRGLRGDAIRLEARIIAVADVVEAMDSHRPYRESLGIEAALAEITQHRGSLFDPAAVDACLRLFTQKGYTFKK